jgi:2-polyprenyl-3-methyl-5-hydroxy-6-metoxy-1,4-benzoquinol methylase
VSPTGTALPSFSDVDGSCDRSTLVAALDEQADYPAIERLRAKGIRGLAPGAGHRLLDAGCGTGDVTRRLAAAVGATGTVVGVDASSTMLAEARRRATGAGVPIELRHSDLTDLDAGDGEFDGVYCERVFQHLDDPRAALAELVRVTRPGGRIVVIDTDWGMHALHGADQILTSRVVSCWPEHARNGLAGRQLPALFTAAGLADPVIVADTITSRDPRPPSLQPFATMAAFARRVGGLTPEEADRWLDELAAAGAHGTFFWAVTLVAACGTREAEGPKAKGHDGR